MSTKSTTPAAAPPAPAAADRTTSSAAGERATELTASTASIKAWSVADVRAAETDVRAGLGEDELMIRAATGLAEVIASRAPKKGRIVVLAGSGGNGGDALYAAAALPELLTQAGANPKKAHRQVTVIQVAREVHAAALAAVQDAGVEVIDVIGGSTPNGTDADGNDADRNDAAGGGGTGGDGAGADASPQPWAGLDLALAVVAGADVVVDGITGIGGSADLRQDVWDAGLQAVIESVDEAAYVISVDLPSGLDPAGERIATRHVTADETVTFGVLKPVHLLAGSDACGLLTVVDIGVSVETTPAATRLSHDDAARLWPVPGPEDDKYRRGVLGIVAGGENYTGAPQLSVTAAVAAGAGMVRYVGPKTPTALVRAAVPEAVHGAGRVQAWVVGPGLPTAKDARSAADKAQIEAAKQAIASDEPCLIDAGGLELLTRPRTIGRSRRPAPTLLTPHAGELAALLTRLEKRPASRPVTREQVSADPVGHARRAAALTKATVLLKGATTYLVGPHEAEPVRAQSDAPAWAGTAGSGDVLAGLAGMLLAAGLSPMGAGSLAALVHGLAAQAANPGGPIRALGIAHAIPGVVAGLLTRPEA